MIKRDIIESLDRIIIIYIMDLYLYREEECKNGQRRVFNESTKMARPLIGTRHIIHILQKRLRDCQLSKILKTLGRNLDLPARQGPLEETSCQIPANLLAAHVQVNGRFLDVVIPLLRLHSGHPLLQCCEPRDYAVKFRTFKFNMHRAILKQLSVCPQ